MMNELRLAEVISSGLMYEWPLHARRVKCGACGTQMADLQGAWMEQLSISHFGCKPERM